MATFGHQYSTGHAVFLAGVYRSGPPEVFTHRRAAINREEGPLYVILFAGSIWIHCKLG